MAKAVVRSSKRAASGRKRSHGRRAGWVRKNVVMDQRKLDAVRERLASLRCPPSEVRVVDVGDPRSLRAMAESTRVVLTTVGTWPPDVGFRRLELPNAFETNEDVAVALTMTMSQVDPAEHGQVQIEGLPEGSALSAGVLQADGSWLLEAADLAGLTLTLITFLVESRDTLIAML